MKLIDLTGKVFGKLTVIRREGGAGSRWACRCKCGRETVAQAGNLKNGHTSSCGCSRHGQCGSITYSSWSAMKSRCTSESNPNYPRYGGRGITICGRWRSSFVAFLSDMGERPSLQHSIDRIDNDGNYEPSNCRWATWSEQRNNQTNNRTRALDIEHHGVTLSVREWSERIGISERTLGYRLRSGWTTEKALTAPVSAGRSKAGKISQLSRRTKPFSFFQENSVRN